MSFLGLESIFGVGLTSPLFLAALPFGVAALVYAYLKRGRGTPIVVPSILILKLLDHAQVARKNFVPPIRFFVELLIVLLLVAAAAGIYSSGSKKRSAILIDNSFSMGAVDPANPSAGSYFTQALEHARLAIQTGESSEVELFVSSPNFKSLSSGFVSSASAIALLSEIHPEFANDSLQNALQQLASDPKYTKILVFTDKEFENSPAQASGPRVGHSSRFQVFRVRDERVSVQNLALLDLRLFKPGIQSNSLNLSALVGNFSTDRIETDLTLEMEREPDDPSDLRVIRRQTIKLKAGESSEYTFENLPSLPIFHVYIDTKESAALARDNAQSGDDQGWILSKPKKQEIAVISTEDGRSLGFERLKSLGIKYYSPSEVSESLLNDLAVSQTLAIFHNVTPPKLPDLNAIFINPPEADAIFNSSGTVNRELKVTSWSDSHPITTYLNLPTLQLPRITALQVPSWAEKIIQTNQGTVALAGEFEGKKYAAFGFDLLPFSGSGSPLRSVLFLNTVKWISQLGSSANYEVTNRPIPALRDLTDVVTATGDLVPLSSSASIKTPGLYSATLKDGSREFIAINFFNGSESNLLSPGKISPPTESLEGIAAPNSSELRDTLIYLVLAFLLLELFTWGARGGVSLKALIRAIKNRNQNLGGAA